MDHLTDPLPLVTASLGIQEAGSEGRASTGGPSVHIQCYWPVLCASGF